jgi:hypothetical protein
LDAALHQTGAAGLFKKQLTIKKPDEKCAVRNRVCERRVLLFD